MKKFNGHGWKFFGKLRKKHWRVQKQTFQQVSEILKIIGSLWKSSEVFGKLRKFVTKCLK